MAVTSQTSGTQTATLTTEHTLATITDAGVYVLEVDTGALVNGETVRLRAYKKTLSGGTSRVAFDATYLHAQGEPVKVSVPVASATEVAFTLRQDGGTGRAFPWNVLKVG